MKLNPKHRENTPVYGPDGKLICWDSRSVAVCILAYSISPEGIPVVLLHRRGPGCPNEVGKKSLVCGYLDKGEYLPEAAAREFWQETGIEVSPERFVPCGISDTLTPPENITIRFALEFPWEEFYSLSPSTDTLSRGGEKDEVTEHFLLGVTPEILQDPEDWAFGHNQLIYEVLQEGTISWTCMGIEKIEAH